MDSTPVSITGAAADLSAKRYRFGKMTSSGPNVCSVAGERADFVIGNKPVAGDPVSAYIERTPEVEYGGNVTKGDNLTTDANGRAVVATSGQYVNGKAMHTGVAGDVREFLRPLSAPLSGGGTVAVAAPGAIPPTADHVLLSVDGTDAFTLAAGTEGHTIVIECIAAANTPLGTVTLADAYGSEPLTWVFTAVGQKLTLLMTDTGWKVEGIVTAGTESLLTTETAKPLVKTHLVNVNGTNDYIQPSGVIAGQKSIWIVTAGSTASTISGLFYTTAGAATGVDLAINAASDMAVLEWDGARWLGVNLVSVTVA